MSISSAFPMEKYRFGRKIALINDICSQCEGIFTDFDSDGLDICPACGEKIRISAGNDPKDASRFRHRLLMASRQLERKMLGQR